MNEINENDELEIKEKNDSAKQNKSANNFYTEKLNNITEGGIYNLVKNLCEKFCRNKDYKINIWNEKDLNGNAQQKHANFQTDYESRYPELHLLKKMWIYILMMKKPKLSKQIK